jgi:hypothetical protein
MRVPEGDELALLMRCTGYRFNRNGVATRLSDPPTPEDLATARELGWTVGELTSLTAREIVDRSRAAVARLSRDEVALAFVAGVGGSALRGRQVLISYAWALHLPAGPEVPDCGLRPVEEIDVTKQLVRLACGWAWNEMPADFVLDLEAAASQGLPKPTGDDWAVLDRLLDIAGSQPPDQTPGGLEKELARAKVLPRTDKYQRYGILIALAEAGVLPNPVLAPSLDRFVPTAERWAASSRVRSGPRSDIVVPLGAWRGRDGVDRERAGELFGGR